MALWEGERVGNPGARRPVPKSAHTTFATGDCRRRDTCFYGVPISPQAAPVGSGFFSIEELRIKREMLHVVITGRNAKEELIDLADLVTEMKLVKHPYKAGIKAQRGVEF